MQAQKELDTRGMNCPLPILKAKKALAEMSSGGPVTFAPSAENARTGGWLPIPSSLYGEIG